MVANNQEKGASIRELWLARNVVVDILAHRGFTTSQKSLSYNEFTAQYPSACSSPSLLNFTATRDNAGAENAVLSIHFTADEKLPKASLEALVGGYIGQGVSNVMLITPSKLNPACKAFLKGAKLVVEHFLLEELQFNVLKHELVPPHRILSAEEAKSVLKRLRAEIGNLPVLLTTDIVNRYIGGNVGDIVEITRNSLTAGKSIYYRAVKEL